ncbi:MAG: segregation and condensation protein A [Phycisphaerales bacterium]
MIDAKTTDTAADAAERSSANVGRSAGPDRGGSEYTVRLDAFEGPLDLLLFLIRRAEVEITDIPIAKITEQYLRHLEQLTSPSAGGRIDIEQAGEFLVMAATLMEIKSRMLSPRPAPSAGGFEAAKPADEAGDPRSELVRQLLEYKRFRDATDRLEDYRREWDQRYPSARAAVGKPDHGTPENDPVHADSPVDVEDLQLIDLIQAFARIVESVDFNRVGEHHVKLDDTPVEVHGERILDSLRRRAADGRGEAQGAAGVEFAELFRDRSRSEMIGMFLAILELVKQQRVLVRQEAIVGEGSGIVLELAELKEPDNRSEEGSSAGPGTVPAPTVVAG